MEYRIYTTPAFVLNATPRGEADKQLTLLTRDLGVVYADAKGIRQQRSKLRFALQWLALAQVSLVYGKGGWRIVNALPAHNYAFRLRRQNPGGLSAAARIAMMVRKLVAGEERDEGLFFDMYDMLQRITARSMQGPETRAVERLVLLRILARLGYVGEDSMLSPLLASRCLCRKTCRELERLRSRAVRTINASLTATHLV